MSHKSLVITFTKMKKFESTEVKIIFFEGI